MFSCRGYLENVTVSRCEIFRLKLDGSFKRSIFLNES